MAQTYTLDEAAQRLGLSTDDFKRRLKTEWTSIRSFRDGATLRFRSADIDELARSLGQASDPDLQLAPPGAPPQPTSTDEFLLPEDLPAPMSTTDEGSGTDDIFALTAGDSGKVRKKSPGDSDVRLELDPGPQAGSDPDLSLRTEEMALDLSSQSGTKHKGGSSGKLKAPPKSGYNLAASGPRNKIPGPPTSDEPSSKDSSSEFELSLDPDSDSFEIQLTQTDSSDEVELGVMPSSGKPAGAQSGINLAKPSDSGVSLESNDDSSSEFELSLDTESAPPPSSGRLGGKGNKIPASMSADSDSEFELTLDDGSSVGDAAADELAEQKGDIFETDFELPAVSADSDSESEVIAVESSDTDLENSDFDIALDESDIQAEDDSASQVVLLDDESDPGMAGNVGRAAGAAALGAAAAGAASRRRKPVDIETDSDEDDSAGSALKGVSRRSDDDEEDEYASSRPARATSWGVLPVAVLLPTLVISFLGAIMSYETLRGMWSYHHGQQPSGALVRSIAGMLDMDPK